MGIVFWLYVDICIGIGIGIVVGVDICIGIYVGVGIDIELVLVASASIWHLEATELATSGSLWQHLGPSVTSGIIWQPLRAHASIWMHRAAPGTIWAGSQHLAPSELWSLEIEPWN